MKLEYRDGLLYTSIQITHHGKTATINNIVVDTGASYCIIEPSAIEDLGLIFTKDDEIETFYGVNSLFSYVKRTADTLKIGDKSVENINFYVGTVDESVDGLLGLDVLINSGAVIDLKNLEIKF